MSDATGTTAEPGPSTRATDETSNPCGNPYCTCGENCACGPGCRCGIPDDVDVPGAVAGAQASSDTCSCGAGCACGSETRPMVLAGGALAGLLIPVAAGLLSRALDDGATDASHEHMHGDTMGSAATTLPTLGDGLWFYSAMAVVLAVGLVHAYASSRRNACGSTPLGMGLMWGAMLAMSIGMASGVH